ncbi:beta-agarase [Dyella solisilvae]|uniref:Beta-agarase n=1 Tax=Dyella solisilvae TaxID=1920168 RepID=A0A370K9B1_9GAMM|nr:beta-agarase [Dyella solisilvae]RDI99221.1 beta-agarase [Dyella solisilvae]
MRRIVPPAMCCLLALAGCHKASDTDRADLSRTAPATTPATNGAVTKAPSTQTALEQVQRDGAPVTVAGMSLQRYTFQPAPTPQLVVSLTQGEWDWSKEGSLHVDMQNAMPWAVTLTVDIDGVTAGQHLHATVGVPAGPPQTLVIPLHATSPRDMGMQVGPPMPYVAGGKRVFVATTVEGSLDLAHVKSVRIGIPAPTAPQTVLFGKLDTSEGNHDLRDAYTGIVDAWGQYTRGQWPGKIDSDDALRGHRQKFQAKEPAPAPVVRKGFDRYGGRTDLAAFKATGWFRTERRDGRWQLVTPEGHAFFSLGVNVVDDDGGRTFIQGREFMFKDLPPDSGRWKPFYGSEPKPAGEQQASSGLAFRQGRWFDYYSANLFLADGHHWRLAWRQRTAERLQHWGFNTLGNWSDDALTQTHHLAYTRSVNIAGVFGNVSSGYDYWGRMPDPFDPRFAQAADAAAAQAAREVRDDPWLLGYFADNELAWAGQGPQGRWGLAQGALRGEARSPAKQAFIAQLQKKYGTPAKLAAAWGITLENWDALNATNFAAPNPDEAHPAIADDYSAWLRAYADQYFRTVAQAIHKHDPHHLFLGGRFAVHTPEAVASCAQYCDVVSFNAYADVPEHAFDLAAFAKLDKPALITEFHFGSNDRGPFGKGLVPVWTEEQRGEAYAHYIAAAVANPVIVGAHWFQYVDQPVTGRLLDGENSHIGLVAITDHPFTHFVQAVREANHKTGY